MARRLRDSLTFIRNANLLGIRCGNLNFLRISAT